MSRLEWDMRGARVYLRDRAREFILRLCLLTVRRAKELLSVPGTGLVKGTRVGPVVHSRPGEPPFKQTGRGRASVTYEFDPEAMEGRAGTNVEYMAHLERGTKRGILPRPWLRPAVEWALSMLPRG